MHPLVVETCTAHDQVVAVRELEKFEPARHDDYLFRVPEQIERRANDSASRVTSSVDAHFCTMMYTYLIKLKTFKHVALNFKSETLL